MQVLTSVPLAAPRALMRFHVDAANNADTGLGPASSASLRCRTSGAARQQSGRSRRVGTVRSTIRMPSRHRSRGSDERGWSLLLSNPSSQDCRFDLRERLTAVEAAVLSVLAADDVALAVVGVGGE